MNSVEAGGGRLHRHPGRNVWLVGLLSLALNLTGITWGLPARWHPDEKADIVARMVEDGRLEPETFVNPSLPLYVMFPVVWLQAQAARLGLLSGVLADPTLACRILSGLAGAGAVVVLGATAARLNPVLGPLAALLLALSPGFVNLSHFATPEPWLFLGTTATLAMAVAHAESRTPPWLLGLVLGLTVSTKYTAVALLAPVLAAVWLRPRSRSSGREPVAFVAMGLAGVALAVALGADPGATLAGRLHLKDPRLLHPEHAVSFVWGLAWVAGTTGAALMLVGTMAWAGQRWAGRLVRIEVLGVGVGTTLGFLLGTPYALARPVGFLSDLAFNQQTRFEYKGLAAASSSYVPYFGLVGDALTGPLLAAALAGTVVALARGLRRDVLSIVLLAAALAPYLLVASGGHQALRFLAPTLPPLAALAALGLAAIRSAVARRTAVALVAARAALGTLLVIRLFFVDSRTLAGRWLERNVPAGQTVDLITNNPGYGPSPPEGLTLRIVPILSREMAPRERFAEAASRYPAEASPWLVLTASYYERFLEHPDQAPERAAFFGDLLAGRRGFEVVARFCQRGWLRPAAEFLDPEIVILRKRGAGQDALRGNVEQGGSDE